MTDYYGWGYRNGRLDAMLGLRLEIALSSGLARYAEGYRAGQRDWRDTVAALGNFVFRS